MHQVVVILLIIHNNSIICGKYGEKIGIKIDKCPILLKSKGFLNGILVKSLVIKKEKGNPLHLEKGCW